MDLPLSRKNSVLKPRTLHNIVVFKKILSLNSILVGGLIGAQSKIFKDREKLSPRYVPLILPHREKQIESLYNSFREALADPSRALLKIIQIVGPAGSGKTSSVLRFGQRFEQDAAKLKRDIRHVYVNLKLQGGSRVVLYRYLLEAGAPEVYSSSLSAEEMLRVMLRQLRERKRYLLISLDEIDYFIRSTKDTGVVYDLTRLNEIELGKPCNVLGVIFTARSKDFQERLDRAELSTLGRIPIEFSSYTSIEIVDILADRVKEAFQQRVVSDEVLEYVADLTVSSPVNGDLRYALDLLLYSGNLAENQGAEQILPDHVRRVHGETHPSITEEDILNLPKKEHLIALLAVVKSLRNTRKTYTSMRDIRLNCGMICEDMHLKPTEDLDDYLQDLHDRRIIEIRSLKEIGISGVPTENLGLFLDSLFNRLETGLNVRQS
ncbi:MAG: AAA family ATPase [Nitrososphaeria archaeon]|jgi:cell division control protein 6